MSYYVPDFGIEEDDPFSSAFDFPNRKPLPDSCDDDLAEILWKKGPVIRRFPPPIRPDDLPCRPNAADAVAEAGARAPSEGVEAACELFMGEDEMASWLHYSLESGGGGSENTSQWISLDRRPLARPPAQAPGRPTLPPPPPPPPAVSLVVPSKDLIVVDSNMTPDVKAAPPDLRVSTMAARDVAATHLCEKGTTSTSGGSGEHVTHADSRKRKARDFDDTDGEDGEYESDDNKKNNRKPARRTRAAKVHNLSERRRRDRINEKMKALQQLIPRCNKSDKASMLDDAVEYLKSLQLQIQMMSMGCTMTPMMFPGMQQYIPPMGMSMGMGMDTSAGCLAHPMLPFSPVSTASHLGTRMPMQAFHPASMAVIGQIRAQATSQGGPQSNLVGLQGPNPVQVPNLLNPFHPYFGFQSMQLPTQHNQGMTKPGISKGSNTETSKLG